jgi:hypothetical protein
MVAVSRRGERSDQVIEVQSQRRELTGFRPVRPDHWLVLKKLILADLIEPERQPVRGIPRSLGRIGQDDGGFGAYDLTRCGIRIKFGPENAAQSLADLFNNGVVTQSPPPGI